MLFVNIRKQEKTACAQLAGLVLLCEAYSLGYRFNFAEIDL
jgi:hypothetical protein